MDSRIEIKLMSSSQVKILYIIGTGRNGSTLLDVFLGNAQKLQSAGELYSFHRAFANKKQCACGNQVSACSFWGEVQTRLTQSDAAADDQEMLTLQNRFEKQPLSPTYFAFHRWFGTRTYRKYQRFLQRLYSTVSTVAQKPVLVDSSKNPLRGQALLDAFGADVYFIHLIRDGRGQLWSWMKTGEIPPFGIPIQRDQNGESKRFYWWAAILYACSWVFYNLLASRVCRRAGRGHFLRIQYDAFVRHPERYVAQIADMLNEDLSDLHALAETRAPFRPDHLIAGNRMRFLKEVTLRQPDEEWKTRLVSGYKRSFWLVAGWLSRLYGYKYTY